MNTETKKTTPSYMTKLKFIESSQTGELIAFVSIDTNNGRFYGVSQKENVPKKIVVLGRQVRKMCDLKSGILYDVELKTMGKDQNFKSCKGFVVVNAKQTMFDAKIDDDGKGGVKISFGNVSYGYNPRSAHHTCQNLSKVIKKIDRHSEIKDKELAIQGFRERSKQVWQKFKDSYPELIQELKDKYAEA